MNPQELFSSVEGLKSAHFVLKYTHLRVGNDREGIREFNTTNYYMLSEDVYRFCFNRYSSDIVINWAGYRFNWSYEVPFQEHVPPRIPRGGSWTVEVRENQLKDALQTLVFMKKEARNEDPISNGAYQRFLESLR